MKTALMIVSVFVASFLFILSIDAVDAQYVKDHEWLDGMRMVQVQVENDKPAHIVHDFIFEE